MERAFHDRDRAVQKSVYVSNETIIETNDIISTRSRVDENGNRVVRITLTELGAEKLFQATSTNLGGSLAIMFGDEVKAVPVIRGAIGGQFEVTGSFTDAEVDHMNALNRNNRE